MTSVYGANFEGVMNNAEIQYRGLDANKIEQPTTATRVSVEERVTYHTQRQDMSSETLRAMARNPSLLRLYERS